MRRNETVSALKLYLETAVSKMNILRALWPAKQIFRNGTYKTKLLLHCSFRALWYFKTLV